MGRAHSAHADRSFGLVMASALLGLAAIRLAWTGTISWWLVGFAFLFLAVALAVPQALVPVRTAWMKFAAVLGFINARILLTLVFAALIIPIALLLRTLGRTPISSSPSRAQQSYWRLRRPEEFTAARMERQF